MAKSLRSKAKLAARRKRRTETHYAVAGAARVERISAKLLGKSKAADKDEDEEDEKAESGDAEMEEGIFFVLLRRWTCAHGSAPKKVSTSAPRDTRRESWRLSKGMSARPKNKGQNGLGQAAGRRKAGRPKRRR
jgi:hypothetical protein